MYKVFISNFKFLVVNKIVMRITYNTRLLFNSEECKQNLIKMLEAARFCWNECSKVKYKSVPKNSIVDLHTAFYRKFRDENPKIPSTIVVNSEQSCLSAYRSIKSSKNIIKKPCEKKILSIRLDSTSYSYKTEIFSIISLEKRIKCRFYKYPKLEEYLNKYKFCDPLLFERNRDVWISLTFDIPEILSPNKLKSPLERTYCL